MSVSVGIGLTNNCNLNCAHCYRDPDALACLSLEEIKLICERLHPTSFNLGTGENYLHPDFTEIVTYLADGGYKLSMASNGHSFTAMPEALLRRFHDVEVSIDFATAEAQDAFRTRGNWDLVMAAIARCQKLGLEVTILATLMAINYDQMDGLAQLAGRLGTNLRVNAYQPVQTSNFTPDYEQFWEGYRRLLSSARLVSTSEPIVNAVLGLDDLGGSPCGRQSIRFTPHGDITPCVYWPHRDLTLSDLPHLDEAQILASEQFQRSLIVPAACGDCPHVHSCGGGCASRRALLGDLDQPDPYCPLVRGEEIQLDFTPAPARDLPRGRNVCTTIVVP